MCSALCWVLAGLVNICYYLLFSYYPSPFIILTVTLENTCVFNSHPDHSRHLSGLLWEVPNLLSDSVFVPAGLFSMGEIGSKSASANTPLFCSHPLWLPSSSDQSQRPSLAPRIPATSLPSPPFTPHQPCPPNCPSHTGLFVDSQT